MQNTASGNNSLHFNTTGNNDAASGFNALYHNTTGNQNTATGAYALFSNTVSLDNDASGYEALSNNTTAGENVAVGSQALFTQSFNNGGVAWNGANVAVGYRALFNNQPNSNTNGVNNTAVGTQALTANTTGIYNTALGYQALFNNTTGGQNTGVGLSALFNTTSGIFNTGVGSSALGRNTTGSSNIALGTGTLFSNFTGSNLTGLGYQADVGADGLTNSTAIGNGAIVSTSNTIQLGNSSISTLNCKVGLTVTSDRNAKENFRAVDGAEVVRKVSSFEIPSWNYIGQDPKTQRHYGPMAQDFYGAFGRDSIGTSGNDTTINSSDMAGITLIAVKELSVEHIATQSRGEEQERQIETLRDENITLKNRLAELEKREQERDARLVRIEQQIK